MIQNFLKIALRNLRKQAGYTAINIVGLALGLAACLLISLWVLDELSFDRFHEKSARIYRSQADIRFGGADMSVATSPPTLAGALEKDYPQIETVCRFRERGGFSVRRDDKVFSENRVLYSDPTVFDIFTFPLAEGDPHSALQEPNCVVISEKVAKKYFFGRSPIGETLKMKEDLSAKITGVMRDLPDNSQVQADFFVSMSSLEESKENNWLSFNFNTFFLFREGYDPAAFEPEWRNIVLRYVAPMGAKALNINWEEFEKSGSKVQFSMVPLLDIHLHGGNRTGNLSPAGSAATVRIFGIIALFILLLAAVNFMNLSTARSAQRAREVGVRKVMGSQKGQLMGQFLTESALLSLFAGLLALPLVRLFLPFFNQISNKKLSLDFWAQPSLLVGVVGFILLTGLLAGIYPAFVLSGFQPIKVLKANSLAAGNAGGVRLRNALVTSQFAISLVLMVGALVTWRQMNFIQNKNLGFDRSQVLVVNDASALGEKSKVFKSEVLKLPMVESGTVSGFLPTIDNHSDQAFFKEKEFKPENGISLINWTVDADYLKTMKIGLQSGRNFDATSPADSNAILINLAAVKLLGYDDPIGKEIYTLRDVDEGGIETYKIVGVIENFHFESLRDEIKPMLMQRGNYTASISFRLKTNDLTSTIGEVRAIWERTAPGLPFNYEFMDEQFDHLYRSEARAGTLIFGFAALAILIACLGLFGLAAFTAQRRTREIGIRKVLGATVAGVTALLARDFLKLVGFAFLVASPIAYFFMKKWLADFAYRIELEWWMFVVAGAAAVAIAFLTVGFQSVKAALANPSKSLRSE